jgi:DNA-binding FadR family transcriptional regulator
MSRFFFHLNGIDTLVEDTEGTDLPGVEAARAEAEKIACELAAERLRHGEIVKLRSVYIALQDAGIVAEVLTADALAKAIPAEVANITKPSKLG